MIRAIGVGLGALLLASPVWAAPPPATASAGTTPAGTTTAGTATAGTAARTRFAVIATTQGGEPDTTENFVRLYERQRARFGAPIGIRVFSGGALPLADERSVNGRILAWAARHHPEEIITVSHKTRDDARLRTFLDWVLANRLRVSIIHFHEVQDDWFGAPDRGVPAAEPETYKATYRAYRAVIADHRAASRVTLEKNLTWYWQHYRAPTAGGDWQRYVEADDPADVLSWDAYAFPGMPTGLGRYATPDEFFRYARDAWRQHGIAWGVGEIGTAVQDGGGIGVERNWDPTGALFAAWVRRVTTAASIPAGIGPSYTGMPPARFMKWWQGNDRLDVDLSLDQNAAATAAYRARVRASRGAPE